MTKKTYDEGRTVTGGAFRILIALMLIASFIAFMVLKIYEFSDYGPWILVVDAIIIAYLLLLRSKLVIDFENKTFKTATSLFGILVGSIKSMKEYDLMIMRLDVQQYNAYMMIIPIPPRNMKRTNFVVELHNSNSKRSELLYHGSRNMATEIAIDISNHFPQLRTFKYGFKSNQAFDFTKLKKKD